MHTEKSFVMYTEKSFVMRFFRLESSILQCSCQYAKESVALSFLHSFAYEPSIMLSIFQEVSNGSEFSQKLNEKGTFRNFSPRLWKRHSNICMQRADYEFLVRCLSTPLETGIGPSVSAFAKQLFCVDQHILE